MRVARTANVYLVDTAVDCQDRKYNSIMKQLMRRINKTEGSRRILQLWDYVSIDSKLEHFHCFAPGCQGTVVKFMVFPAPKTVKGVQTNESNPNVRFKVAVCLKHLNRYKNTGKMPRRQHQESSIFRNMP